MKIIRASSAVLLVLAVFCDSIAFGEDSPSSKSFHFKKTKQADLSLTAFFPSDWKPDQKRPAIVFFFGGGWTKGTTKQFEPQSKYLAERGLVALCADYRVKSRHDVTPDVCVQDAKSAIRWVRKNAEILGVDPNRIIGAGGSAGGHLAACTGICEGLDSKDEDQSISSKPNLLVLFNPVLNFNQPRLTERLGDNAELANAISPTQHLAKDSPPVLILFGTDDKLLAQGEEFMNRSKELGHRAEIYLAQGVGHGFFNKSPWQEKTIQRMDTFLVSHGYLKDSTGKELSR